MQRPDEKKRQLITSIAARMFAEQPFHKVKLDDIAAEAGVGKGTLYTYFQSKDDLYFSLLHHAFGQMIDRLTSPEAAEHGSPRQRLSWIVGELVHFGFQHPQLCELMRRAGVAQGDAEQAWDKKRQAVARLLEQTIREGIAAGELDDPHPELTALCIPGLIRAVMLFGPKDVDESAIIGHIVRLLERGIGLAPAPLLAHVEGDE